LDEGSPHSISGYRKARRQYHGAYVFGGSRFEQIGAAAGAVSDVVSYEIRYHCRVARVVLRNSSFDFADQVGSHVGGFGVNPPAKRTKSRNKGCAKPITDDQEWNLVIRDVADAAQNCVESANSQQAHRHDK